MATTRNPDSGPDMSGQAAEEERRRKAKEAEKRKKEAIDKNLRAMFADLGIEPDSEDENDLLVVFYDILPRFSADISPTTDSSQKIGILKNIQPLLESIITEHDLMSSPNKSKYGPAKEEYDKYFTDVVASLIARYEEMGVRTGRNSEEDVEAEASTVNVEDQITPEEFKQLNKWQKFFYANGKDQDGKLLRLTPEGRDIIRGPKEDDSELKKVYIRNGRNRFFSEWYINSWNNQMKFPNSFNKAMMHELPLPEVDHDLKFVDLTSEGSGMDVGFGFMWGVTRMLNMGADMYKLQLAGKETFEAYRGLELGDIDHMFKLGYLASGELTATAYLQMAHQFLVLHDPVKRKSYKPLLEDHLGKHAFSFLKDMGDGKVSEIGQSIMWLNQDKMPGGTQENAKEAINLLRGKIKEESKEDGYGVITYGGDEIHEIMVQQDKGISAEQKKLVIYQLSLFLIQQDRVRLRRMIDSKVKKPVFENGRVVEVEITENNCNPLNFKHAQFVAELMLNIGSAFQIFSAQDHNRSTKKIVSKMFFARLMELGEYRAEKIASKKLGSVRHLSFFKKLIPKGFEEFLVDKHGVTLEQVWMLGGVGEKTGVGESNINLDKEWLREFFRFKPTITNEMENVAGTKDIRKIDELRVRDFTNWEFPQDIGVLYDRLGGFVMPFYNHITGSERLVDDWLGGGVTRKAESIKKFHNDVVGYYFGDINISVDTKKNESDDDFYKRTVLLRHMFAQKGYILVKGKKRDKNNLEFYVGKDGKLTKDYREAKDSFTFTPSFDYFGVLSNDDLISIRNEYSNKISDSRLMGEFLRLDARNVLPFLSVNEPKLLQEILTNPQVVHPDILGKVQDRFTQWLLIGEMSEVADSFKDKKTNEKEKIIYDVFSGLNQNVYNLRYLTPKSRWRGEKVELSGFGRFSFDDVYWMLINSGWISNTFGVDIAIKKYILSLRVQAGLGEHANLKSEVEKALDELKK